VNSFLHDNNHPATFETLITPPEVAKLIKAVSSSHSCGPDGISNNMLKHLNEDMLIQVTRLINLSIEASRIPTAWKSSNVTMITKKADGKLSDMSNFRPISLTSVMCKLTERVLLRELKHFADRKNLIIAQQSGFRNHRSTHDNLVYLTQKISEGFNRRTKA